MKKVLTLLILTDGRVMNYNILKWPSFLWSVEARNTVEGTNHQKWDLFGLQKLYSLSWIPRKIILFTLSLTLLRLLFFPCYSQDTPGVGRMSVCHHGISRASADCLCSVWCATAFRNYFFWEHSFSPRSVPLKQRGSSQDKLASFLVSNLNLKISTYAINVDQTNKAGQCSYSMGCQWDEIQHYLMCRWFICYMEVLHFVF